MTPHTNSARRHSARRGGAPAGRSARLRDGRSCHKRAGRPSHRTRPRRVHRYPAGAAPHAPLGPQAGRRRRGPGARQGGAVGHEFRAPSSKTRPPLPQVHGKGHKGVWSATFRCCARAAGAASSATPDARGTRPGHVRGASPQARRQAAPLGPHRAGRVVRGRVCVPEPQRARLEHLLRRVDRLCARLARGARRRGVRRRRAAFPPPRRRGRVPLLRGAPLLRRRASPSGLVSGHLG